MLLEIILEMISLITHFYFLFIHSNFYKMFWWMNKNDRRARSIMNIENEFINATENRTDLIPSLMLKCFTQKRYNIIIDNFVFYLDDPIHFLERIPKNFFEEIITMRIFSTAFYVGGRKGISIIHFLYSNGFRCVDYHNMKIDSVEIYDFFNLFDKNFLIKTIRKTFLKSLENNHDILDKILDEYLDEIKNQFSSTWTTISISFDALKIILDKDANFFKNNFDHTLNPTDQDAFNMLIAYGYAEKIKFENLIYKDFFIENKGFFKIDDFLKNVLEKDEYLDLHVFVHLATKCTTKSFDIDVDLFKKFLQNRDREEYDYFFEISDDIEDLIADKSEEDKNEVREIIRNFI